MRGRKRRVRVIRGVEIKLDEIDEIKLDRVEEVKLLDEGYNKLGKFKKEHLEEKGIL